MKKFKTLMVALLLVPCLFIFAACGTAGAKGDTGAQGPKGDPGLTGEKGEPGENATIDGIQAQKALKATSVATSALTSDFTLVNGYLKISETVAVPGEQAVEDNPETPDVNEEKPAVTEVVGVPATKKIPFRIGTEYIAGKDAVPADNTTDPATPAQEKVIVQYEGFKFDTAGIPAVTATTRWTRALKVSAIIGDADTAHLYIYDGGNVNEQEQNLYDVLNNINDGNTIDETLEDDGYVGHWGPKSGNTGVTAVTGQSANAYFYAEFGTKGIYVVTMDILEVKATTTGEGAAAVTTYAYGDVLGSVNYMFWVY